MFVYNYNHVSRYVLKQSLVQSQQPHLLIAISVWVMKYRISLANQKY